MTPERRSPRTASEASPRPPSHMACPNGRTPRSRMRRMHPAGMFVAMTCSAESPSIRGRPVVRTGTSTVKRSRFWTWHANTPLAALVQATRCSKAKGHRPANAACRRRGIWKPLLYCKMQLLCGVCRAMALFTFITRHSRSTGKDPRCTSPLERFQRTAGQWANRNLTALGARRTGRRENDPRDRFLILPASV